MAVNPGPRTNLFDRAARWIARQVGHGFAFTLAFVVIIVWAVSGPLFHWSDTWQLAINTATTIITFLMVFLIQNAQIRDSEAVHIKLDELIRSHPPAYNALLDLEELSEKDLKKIQEGYVLLAERARKKKNGAKPFKELKPR